MAELEVSAKKKLLNFSVSWTKFFVKITWMLVGYLMWMKLPFHCPKHQKVFASKGKHQAGAMTSAERGTDTMCVFYMGSAGMFVPSLLVFKRLHCKFELSTRVSPGTLFACTENGCITSDFLFSGSHILYKR